MRKPLAIFPMIFVVSLFTCSIPATSGGYKEREWTFSEKGQAFRTAMCIARCDEKDKNCRGKCADAQLISGKDIGYDDWRIYEYENGTRLHGLGNFNATLHCRDIDVIRIKHTSAGIWMIEQSTRSVDSSREINRDKIRLQLSVDSAISSFSNLSAGTLYRYRARRVTSDGLASEYEVTPWFETLKMGHRSEQVKSLKVASQRSDVANPSRVRADIIFQPGSDRSCLYEVVSFAEDQGLTIGNLDSIVTTKFPWFSAAMSGWLKMTRKYWLLRLRIWSSEKPFATRQSSSKQPCLQGPKWFENTGSSDYDFLAVDSNFRFSVIFPKHDFQSQDFGFVLDDLEYERNVSIYVSARNRGDPRSSNNVSLTFATPSCLEVHRSVAFCAPERVRGLRVSEMYRNGSNYDLTVEWDDPAVSAFLPDNYTLRVLPVEYFSDDGEPLSVVFTTILPGNATKARITVPVVDTDVAFDDRQRIISMVAESAGGASLQTWIHVTLDVEAPDQQYHVTAATVGIADSPGVRFVAVPAIVVIAILLATIGWFGRAKSKGSAMTGHNSNDHNKSHKYCKNFLDEAGKRRNDEPSTFHAMEKNLKLEFEKKDALLGPMIDKFEIRPTRLTMKGIIGSGASGIVRLGSLRDYKNMTIDVAIKTLKENPNADDLKNFQQEMSIMKSAGKHQNIVSIIGCCTLDVARPMLIVEYCSRGDLQTYLRTIWQDMVSRDRERASRCTILIRNDRVNEILGNKIENITNRIETQQHVAVANQLYDIQEGDEASAEADERITAVDLLSFARQVAAGMEFLSSNRIIHRDLAARNVLLCADKTAKISDFGLSRDIYQENVYKKQGNSRLPLKWMAIEALTHQIYTAQSDVWSFGILLWEIVTLGCNPYPETPTNMILQLLKSGYRMEKPDNCGMELYDIMLSCWRSRPQRRPNFTQLKHQLDVLLRTASDNEYLNIYDLLRETTVISNRPDESVNLIEKNNYSNVYTTSCVS